MPQRELRVRGCGTQRSGCPGMVPGSRPCRNTLGHEQGLLKGTPRCQGPPRFETELPVFLKLHLTGTPGLCPPLRRDTKEPDFHRGPVCPPGTGLRKVGLQRPSPLRVRSALQVTRCSKKHARGSQRTSRLTGLDVPDAQGGAR